MKNKSAEPGLEQGFAKQLKDRLNAALRSCGKSGANLTRTRGQWNAPRANSAAK